MCQVWGITRNSAGPGSCCHNLNLTWKPEETGMRGPVMPHSFQPPFHTQEVTPGLSSFGKKDDDVKRIWKTKTLNNHPSVSHINCLSDISFDLFLNSASHYVVSLAVYYIPFCSLRMRHTFFSSDQNLKVSLMILPSGTQSSYFRALLPFGALENVIQAALALLLPCQLSQLNSSVSEPCKVRAAMCLFFLTSSGFKFHF